MTAETALAMPAIVLMLAVVLSVGQVVQTQIRCIDAARAAARMAARGDSAVHVLSGARAVAPDGSRIAVQRAGRIVSVAVDSTVHLLLPAGPELDIHASAAADVEQPGAS